MIHPRCRRQTTYWALSAYEDLETARKDLQQREGCTKLADIPYIERNGTPKVKIEKNPMKLIENWLDRKPELGAVIWTGLTSNWQRRRFNRPFSVDDAVNYLKELENNADRATDVLRRAREYITNTPRHIQTDVRERIRAEMRWTDKELSKTLFES